jgi:rhodanese-related sulfurtransferase
MRLALAAVVVAACAARERAPAQVSIDDAARGIASGRLIAVDANSELTRKHMGTLPDAVLLTDYVGYAASELPADLSRPLVFYCSNAECTASHDAAARALALGHSDVEIMADGIAGWASAGKPVTRI